MPCFSRTTCAIRVPVFLFWAWVPSQDQTDRQRRDKSSYTSWIREGHLRACKGNIVDFDEVGDLILESVREFAVMEIAYDRRFANLLVTRMERYGIPTIPFGHSTANMNAGTRELLQAIGPPAAVWSGRAADHSFAGKV